MATIKDLSSWYLMDLSLHSNIRKLKDVINLDFEKSVEKIVIENLRKNAKQKGCNTLFAGFINRNFDAVLLEEMNDGILILTALNMKTNEIKSLYLDRKDSNNPMVKYTRTRISNLPKWLNAIIQRRNGEKGLNEIYTHRLVASLKFDISNLVIHHLEYVENEGDRKGVNDNIDFLLPVTNDFHERLIHNLNYKFILKQNNKYYIQKGKELKQTLEDFIQPKNCWNKPSAKTIKNVLVDYYKNGISINELSKNVNYPSRNTITKIIEVYKNLVNFIEKA